MPVEPDWVSPEDALAAVQTYFQDLNADRQMFRDWCAGTPEGGPDEDGLYPLMDFTGHTYLVPCPAKIGATAVESVADLASRAFDYYVDLAEVEGIPDQVCFVAGDNGSHVDPITGNNVPNSGMFRYDLDEGVWTRLTGLGGDGGGGGGGVAQYLDGTPIDQLRPADPGATAGAPSGTLVGGVLAQNLVNNLAQNTSKIAGLETTYGTTQSAAASALAADGARIAAELARNQAITQKTSAEGSALAAAGSATVAGSWANNAETAALASQASMVEAESAFGNAVQAFNDTILVEGNMHFSFGTRAWTNTYQNALAGTEMPAGKWAYNAVWNGLADVLTPISTLSTDYLCGMKRIYVDVTKRYRVECNYRIGAGTGNSPTSIGVACFNASGTFLGLRHPINTPLAPNDNYTLSGLIFGTGAAGSQFAVGTAFVFLVAQLNIGQASTALGGINYLTIEDRTALEQAAFEAAAAAGSANAASTFADNAGSAATAASGSRTAAETAAGNAGTAATTAITQASAAQSSADQANNAASSALGFATDASNHSSTAGGHAQTAQQQASISQTAAAQAGASSLVAASVASNTSIKNPMFSKYTNNAGPADEWQTDTSTGAAWLRVAGRISPYAMRNTCPSNTLGYTAQELGGTTERTLLGDQYWVLQAEVVLTAGSFQGSGLVFRAYNQARTAYTDYALSFINDPDSTGSAVGNGVIGSTYRFSKLIRIQGNNNHNARIYSAGHWDSGLGTITSTNTIDWQSVGIRPATAVEIKANNASADLAAVTALIFDEAAVRVAADTSLANRTSTVEARINNGTSGLGALDSRVSNEVTARTNADTALANRATALESSVNHTTTGLAATLARVTTEETTRATADTALGSRADTITARLDHGTTGLNALSSRITSEATARTDADSALATRTSSLEAATGHSTTGLAALSSRISAELTARANADTALATRTTNLEAATAHGTTGLAALSARITSEVTARTNGDSANATSINNISTTVNGHTASINSVVASVNGQRARVAMTLDVNGYVTGWETSNNGASGQMIIRADRFAVGAPGAGIFPFRVEGGSVFIHNAVISYGSLGTDKLASNSVTAVYTLGNGATYYGNNAYQTTIEYDIPMDYAGDIILILTATQGWTSVGASSFGLRILIDGMQVNALTGSGSVSIESSLALSASLPVGAGWHKVTFSWYGTTRMTLPAGQSTLVAIRRYR